MPWIGNVPLDKIHSGTLQPWVDDRVVQGKATNTINHGLKIVRRVLNLAATEWVDNHGLTWLLVLGRSSCYPTLIERAPYPLTWDEQDRLFQELPDYLRQMALFAVNTGCRSGEICQLRWEWETLVPELGTSVFLIPSQYVKNGDDRLVVLNSTARAVVDARRGHHSTHVFTYDDGSGVERPIQRMFTSGWIRARERAELGHVRVHDLKHTFGRRLRAAGVSFEDRQDLLGHRSGRITTHYSAAELSRLLEAANKVCERSGQPELVVLRHASRQGSRKTPAEGGAKGLRVTAKKAGKALKINMVPRGGIEPPTP